MSRPDLAGRLRKAARDGSLADGEPVLLLSPADSAEIARSLAITGRVVERAALSAGILPERYLRNRKSLDVPDMIRLLDATVAVAGLGGLGGTVAELLARAGVGTLILMDGDVFEASNLNRQILADESRLGCSKAEAAALRIAAVNSGVNVIAHPVFLDSENAEDLLGGADLAVDGLDSIPARFILQDAAAAIGIPMVTAAVAGSMGHAMVVRPQDTGLRGIYGETPPDSKGAERELGCLPHAVALIAAIECAAAVNLLLGRETHLFRRMLAVEMADLRFDLLNLA